MEAGDKVRYVGEDNREIKHGDVLRITERAKVGWIGSVTLERVDDKAEFITFWKQLSDPLFFTLVAEFDDLVELARKAFDDGKITSITQCYDNKKKVISFGVTGSPYWVSTPDNIQECINYINSLYVEKFMINDVNDIVNINKDAVTTLQNGCVFNGNEFKELQTEPKRLLEILKGATVEQAK